MGRGEGTERDGDAGRWGQSLGDSCWRVKLGTWVRLHPLRGPPACPCPTSTTPLLPLSRPRPGLGRPPANRAGSGLAAPEAAPSSAPWSAPAREVPWALLEAKWAPGGPGAASRDTDLGVRAQRHVVMAKVALVLPVKPYGVQEGEGGWGLTSLQD